jgi:hypothetical protein
MKQLPILLLAGLLLAAPASQLSAHTASMPQAQADETLSDATAQKVLDAAAPRIGESSASLYARYQAGSVTITDLGPISNGNRYAVYHRSQVDYIVVDIIQGA